jgi:predicted nucleotidyltransferase
MDREEVLDRIRAHLPELPEMGVSEVSVFGSVARGTRRT